ncbi:MAG: NAD-dependent epimerase/dehydratase family protein, partial [Proteobacteria bacterium]|nr:NAD-dependent epimerase/dehydratase family protein [Pseudomonadota bacterium]
MAEKKTSKSSSVLVTGSTGFLGSRIVEILLEKGYKVRAFVRKTSKIEKLKKLDVEICFGDIADLASLRQAFEGMDYVVHAAADTVG